MGWCRAQQIYGESLCSDVPYKTLLLSISDCAAAVVREMLQKYGKYREEPSQYCLVQVVTQEPQPESREYRAPTGPYHEYILEDDECPLAIIIHHPPTPGQCRGAWLGTCPRLQHATTMSLA